MAFKAGNPGKPKGAKNKATRDIKALLQETVDWNARIQNLIKLADGGNVKAEEILWQYGFGKPVEIQVAPIQIQQKPEDTIKHEHKHTLDAQSATELRKLANILSNR